VRDSDTDPDDITLATYQASADRYIERTMPAAPALRGFLDRFAGMAGSGLVLEIGSGPGWDADYLEQHGVRVTRSDATPAFVARLRAAGHDARLLDVRSDDLGGPYDGVLANAVLLHLSREQFRAAMHRLRQAVAGGGLLAVTLKEGDGEQWSTAKLGLPRHFTYWHEAALHRVLRDTGWNITFLEHVPGRTDRWLHLIARAGGRGSHDRGQ
jgi:SAM-dependent methyltransferase